MNLSADFVAGTALGEPQSVDFVAGTALGEPGSADFVPLPKISSGTSRGYLENTVLNVKVWRLQADSCIPGSAESTALLCAVY